MVRAPESVLPSQLEEGRRILLAAADQVAPPADPPLDEEFERIRRFALPGQPEPRVGRPLVLS